MRNKNPLTSLRLTADDTLNDGRHLYFKYTQPLLLQSIMPLKGLYDNPEIKVRFVKSLLLVLVAQISASLLYSRSGFSAGQPRVTLHGRSSKLRVSCQLCKKLILRATTASIGPKQRAPRPRLQKSRRRRRRQRRRICKCCLDRK